MLMARIDVHQRPNVSSNFLSADSHRLDGNQDGILTKDEFVDGCIKVRHTFTSISKCIKVRQIT